jgi:tetratricopeptide (TPR) repeat protein
MRSPALITLVVVSILAPALFAKGSVSSNIPPEIQGSSHQDTLEVFVAEALNRGDLALVDRVIALRLKLDSNAIQWHFFQGIRSYVEISYEPDRQNEENLHRVQLAMEKAIEIGERRLEANPTDSMALFYTGGACGYLGIAQIQGGGGFIKAGSTAKRGFNYHEQLMRLCPSFHDAYLGPGMKNLMVSALPWIFKPILYVLGLSGSEEKAEQYLTIAYEKGRRVHLEAGGYLAQLYERRENWDKSQEIYADLYRRYPYRVGMCAQ